MTSAHIRKLWRGCGSPALLCRGSAENLLLTTTQLVDSVCFCAGNDRGDADVPRMSGHVHHAQVWEEPDRTAARKVQFQDVSSSRVQSTLDNCYCVKATQLALGIGNLETRLAPRKDLLQRNLKGKLVARLPSVTADALAPRIRKTRKPKHWQSKFTSYYYIAALDATYAAQALVRTGNCDLELFLLQLMFSDQIACQVARKHKSCDSL